MASVQKSFWPFDLEVEGLDDVLLAGDADVPRYGNALHARGLHRGGLGEDVHSQRQFVIPADDATLGTTQSVPPPEVVRPETPTFVGRYGDLSPHALPFETGSGLGSLFRHQD
jgi:hypothetical protein